MEYVLLKDIAREFGLSMTVARTSLRRARITLLEVRPPHLRGQVASALTNADAERVRASWKGARFP